MSIMVEVTTQAPINVEVTQDVTNVEAYSLGPVAISVENGVRQHNLWVTETNPGMSAPGIWVQTNVDNVPGDFTIWIEDGT